LTNVFFFFGYYQYMFERAHG